MAGLERALPASYYLRPEAFALERERVLYREWFCAGRLDQVRRPGSLVVLDVAGESVLLVRTRFTPTDPAAFAVGRFPVWIWMDDPSFYGFPVWPGAALKAAQDVGGREVTAGTRGFEPDPAASERLAGFLRARLPAALGTHVSTTTCLYTLPPDRDFVLGALPGHDRVLVALGAAHAFKFAPLLGRLLADLALHGGTDEDLRPFDPGRAALTAPVSEPHYLV